MACFTKNQQRNGTNCQFEKYVTTSNYFVLNSLDKGHLNSVCTNYVCDKSENARVCAKWQWNALDWCYWIALPASPVVQSSNTVSCVSLSFHTHPCVLAIKLHLSRQLTCWSLRCSWNITCWHCSNYIFILTWTPGFNGLSKDNCKMRWETFKFCDFVLLILRDFAVFLLAMCYSL